MDIIFLEYFSWIWRLLGYDSVSLIKIILLLCHYHILSVSWTQVFSKGRVGSGNLVLEHLVLHFSRHYMFSRGTQRRPLSCYHSDQIELTMSLFYCKVRTVNVQQLLPSWVNINSISRIVSLHTAKMGEIFNYTKIITLYTSRPGFQFRFNFNFQLCITFYILEISF